jgi:hypothetical protein
MHAVKSGETYIFQKLLSDPRTSLNIANFRGETLLYLATQQADSAVIQILIQDP